MAPDYYLLDRNRMIAVLVGPHYGLFLNQDHWRVFFYAAIEDQDEPRVELVIESELDTLRAAGVEVVVVAIASGEHVRDPVDRGRRMRQEVRSLREVRTDGDAGAAGEAPEEETERP